MEFAIMGDTLGETFGDYRPVAPKPFPVRLWNQIRQFRYLASGVKRMKKLEELARSYSVKECADPAGQYAALDRSLDVLNEAYAHHYCASSQSGSYQSALMSILSGGKEKPDTAHYRDAASLMSDLQEVESADVVRSIERLCEKYNGSVEVEQWIQSGDDPGGSPVVGEFRRSLAELMEKHGHRCVREGELREKSWKEDPEKLYSLIRKRFRAGNREAGARISYTEHRQEILSKLGWMTRRILSSVLPPARAAVARREYTKSMAVKVQQQVKKGYLRLAEMMVGSGLLADTDQVFFLTHGELGQYLESRSPEWKELAEERRILFPESFKLKFPDVCHGLS